MKIKFDAGYEFHGIDDQDTQTFPIPRVGDFVDGCKHKWYAGVKLRLVVIAVVFDLTENVVIIELDRP